MSDNGPATAAILTLGFKLKIADSEALTRRLRQDGWQRIDTYIRVQAPSPRDLHSRLTQTRLLATNRAGISGEVEPE